MTEVVLKKLGIKEGARAILLMRQQKQSKQLTHRISIWLQN